MSFVVLDTDVASAILRGRLPESMRASIEGKSLAITLVTATKVCLTAQPPTIHADQRRCTWMYETTDETEPKCSW